jgi:signal transduction histidine kinase
MRDRRRRIIDRLSLGFRFGEERQALSMVYILYFLILLFGIIVILLHTVEKDLLLVSYRYHAVILLSLVELWFLKKRWVNLARVLLLVLIPFLLLILPPLGGVFSDEFYFWFPYFPIGLSLIPHFILHPVRHRVALLLTLAYYLVLVLTIDNYLILLSDGNEKIIPIVIENRFYYKLIPTFIFIFTNVTLGMLFTRIYKYEEIMERQQKDLIQAEKMASLGTLSAGIAHEINNPLNFISGSIQAMYNLIRRKSGNGEARSQEESYLRQMEHLMENASEGVARAEDIITKLAFFSNPVKESRKLWKVSELIDKALSRMEAKLPYYVKMEKEIPENLTVYCHDGQFLLVASHILRNALDALESKADRGRERIGITASATGPGHNSLTRISFYNSGPSIPEKDLKHIFDPFFTSRDTGQGLGLGMSFSYMIIREHGGRIEVNNREGNMEFIVYLPSSEVSA